MVAMPHMALSLRMEDLRLLGTLSAELGVPQDELLSLAAAMGLDLIRDHLDAPPPIGRRFKRSRARLDGVKGRSPFDSTSGGAAHAKPS